MKLKFGLRARMIIIFLIFSIVISLAVKYTTEESYRKTIDSQYQKSTIEIANLAASLIDGDKFVEYGQTLIKDEEYDRTQKLLNEIYRQCNLNFLYAITPVSDTETIYIYDTWSADTTARDIGVLGGREPYDPELPGISTVMESGKTMEKFEITKKTEFGYNATIYAPIKSADGTTVGVVGADISMQNINRVIDDAVTNLLAVMVIIIGSCFIALLLVIQTGIINPIRVLKQCVEELGKGNLGVQVPVRGRHEIADISNVFNHMSFNIGEHIKEVTLMKDGYYKFVPLKIFELLKKKDITQVKLGDYAEITLSVLSMQTNRFEKITEEMESEELFGFMNQRYQEYVPQIQSRGGVVVNYDKGGVTAIYQEPMREALESAITLCQRVHLNSENKVVQIAFGIGYGSVMLGIVGNDNRFEVSMISEQITLVNHLKSVAGKYRACILATGTACGKIKTFEQTYHYRFLGLFFCRVSGKTEKIFDIYDGDQIEDRELKEMTKSKFEEGVKKFLIMEFYQARLCFIEVLKIYRYDYAAREYLYLCNQYYQLDQLDGIKVYIEEC